jgi:quercetin dioxygenase-like cupin family protein
MKPYKDKVDKLNFTIREFGDDIDPTHLKWHRDKEARTVEVLEGKGWQFQIDNELPLELEKGDIIFIPKREWHRVLKGSTKLKVKIYE